MENEQELFGIIDISYFKEHNINQWIKDCNETYAQKFTVDYTREGSLIIYDSEYGNLSGIFYLGFTFAKLLNFNDKIDAEILKNFLFLEFEEDYPYYYFEPVLELKMYIKNIEILFNLLYDRKKCNIGSNCDYYIKNGSPFEVTLWQDEMTHEPLFFFGYQLAIDNALYTDI